MTRRHVIAAGMIVATLVAGGWATSAAKDAKPDEYAAIERFIFVLVKVQQHYVEPVTSKELVDFAIIGVVGGLDPESRSFTKADTEGLLAIGRKDSPDDTYKQVERFVQALGKVRGHYTEPPAIEMLVNLGIEGMLRGLDPQSQFLGLPAAQTPSTTASDSAGVLPDVVGIKSVPYSVVLPNGVAYIQIAKFDEGVRKELDAALADLERQNPRGLILDLRSNWGGPVSRVAEVTEEFVPHGAKMFYTRGRDASQSHDFISSAAGPNSKLPLILLVNPSTAAGSEMVAGCVQDLDLGVVLGQRTAGMGLIQTVILMTKSVDGPRLKLTTARVYTPSGRCIEDEKGEGVDSDSGTPKSVRPEFHSAMGRVIRGGGGILPDLELPAIHTPPIIGDMDRKALFSRYAAKYVEESGKAKAGYPLSQELRDSFTAFLQAEKLEYEADSLAASWDLVQARVRRELARQYGGEEEAARVGIADDEDVATAAALLAQAATLTELFALTAERGTAKPGTFPAPASGH